MMYMKTSGITLHRRFLKMFIESEQMKAVGVKRSFKRFRHGRRSGLHNSRVSAGSGEAVSDPRETCGGLRAEDMDAAKRGPGGEVSRTSSGDSHTALRIS